MTEKLVYQATVSEPNSAPQTYIGQSSTNFKARLGVHNQTFRDPEVSQTSLSNYIHELENQGKEPTVSWKLIDRAQTYSPISGVCQLCTREAYYIVFHPTLASLNARNEIFSACRHKKSTLLFKDEIRKKRKKKKKSPGT